MTIFVSDTFTANDYTLLQNHAPETGGTWVKISANDLNIRSNYLRAYSSGDFGQYYNDAAPGTAEYDVEQDMTKGSGNAGAYARLADSNNYYYWYSTQAVYYLRKIVAGVVTLLDTLTEDFPAGATATKFEIRDASKKVYIGGDQKLTSADNALTSAGYAGVYESDINWHIDNFVATTAGAPPTGYAHSQAMII